MVGIQGCAGLSSVQAHAPFSGLGMVFKSLRLCLGFVYLHEFEQHSDSYLCPSYS